MHCERQYLRPMMYVGWGGLCASLCAAGGALLHSGATIAGGTTIAACGGLVLWMAAAGRMVTVVDQRRLSIGFGWLGRYRWRFELDHIDRVHICMAQPSIHYLGRLYRFALNGRRWNSRGHRGVRIRYDGRRWFVGSIDPVALKSAVTRNPQPVDDLPDYKRHDMLEGNEKPRRYAATPAMLQL